MSDVLHYVTSDGSHREKRYDIHDTTIDLSNLDISQFDTSQLMSNNRLRELRLNGNKIERLDITPLIECKKLGTLILDGETDAETILGYETMEDVAREVLNDAVETYDALTFLPSLPSIKASYDHVKKNEPDWKMIHLFHNALKVVECGWMGYLDLGITRSKQVLKQILDSGLSEEIKDSLLVFIGKTIDNNGPTINLDLEAMSDYGDLVMKIDDVVSQRNAEMNNQFVPVMKFGIDVETIVILESVGESFDTHYADLRMLWLTAYGYEILESFTVGTTCEMKEFVKIQEALSSLGFDVRTNLDPRPYPIIGWRNRKNLRIHGVESPEPEITLPEQLSSEMMEYIWQLAEHRAGRTRTMIATSSDEPVKITFG